MKKFSPLCGLLMASTLASLSAIATAEVKVYGKANLSVHNADTNAGSEVELVSNASRIGFKGSEKLDNGMEVIYQFESEIAIDDGKNSDDSTFKQRNSFLGLKGDFGLVRAGRYDTPVKRAQRKVDLFNDLKGDIKNFITVNDNRPANTLGYESANLLGPVTLVFQYIASEADEVDFGKSASVAFEKNNVYVAFAYEQDVEDEDFSVARLVGQYKIGDLQLGALYEDADNSVDSAQGWLMSASYALNKWRFNAQYGESDIKFTNGNGGSFGVGYKLSKTFKLFSYYTDLGSDKLVGEATSEKFAEDYLGVGAELKF